MKCLVGNSLSRERAATAGVADLQFPHDTCSERLDCIFTLLNKCVINSASLLIVLFEDMSVATKEKVDHECVDM